MAKEEEISAYEKTLIRGRVTNAINKGILTRPSTCGDCGKDFDRIIAHHEDYSKPFDVSWVCHPCHRKRHSHNTKLWDKEAMKFMETANYEKFDYKASSKIKLWLEDYADNRNISTSMLINYITYRYMKLQNQSCKY